MADSGPVQVLRLFGSLQDSTAYVCLMIACLPAQKSLDLSSVIHLESCCSTLLNCSILSALRCLCLTDIERQSQQDGARGTDICRGRAMINKCSSRSRPPHFCFFMKACDDRPLLRISLHSNLTCSDFACGEEGKGLERLINLQKYRNVIVCFRGALARRTRCFHGAMDSASDF